MKKLILFFTFVSSAIISFGQLPELKSCGHTAVTRELWAKNPQLKADYENMILNLLKNSKKEVHNKAAVYTIPIVFHIIHEYGSENITDAQVYDQLEILNNDFNKLNADTSLVIDAFKPLIADVQIQFKLPAYDYKGDCTNGIEHIYSHETNSGDDFSKLHQWDRNKYLNIWVVNSMRDGVAGYAYYPSDIGTDNYFADGIIILNDYIGSIGTSNPYSSRALTHEIGHYLGLAHTWGSTNDPEVGCGDDGVGDTPMTAGHNTCSPSTIVYDYECDSQVLDTVYTFSSVTTASGMTDPSPVPTITSNSTDTDALIFSSFTAAGVSANPAEDSLFAYSDWGTGAADGETSFTNLTGSINTNKYYQFTVSPVLGQAMTLTSITFDVKRDTSGIRTYAVRSSVGNYSSNLSATISPSNADISAQTGNVFFYKNDTTTLESGSKITLSTGYVNLDSPVTFRIYGWNAEDATGTFEIDNVNIEGTFGTIENVQNYMEYSYCSFMFTIDQAEIMVGAINMPESYRDLLVSDSTAIATGVNLDPKPLCTPVADFIAEFKTACVGDAVDFEDVSWNAVVDGRTWTFEDGTPATSSSASPSVTFNTSGWKRVSLVVQNASGSDTLMLDDYIYISSNTAEHIGPRTESFDGAYSGWIIQNPENNVPQWTFTPNFGNYNSGGFMIQNYFEEPTSGAISEDEEFYLERLGGSKDALISPSFDLTTSSNLTLSFNYAYATRGTLESQITEKLNVYVSKNCGKTWILRKSLTGAELLTAGSFSQDFKPTNASFWKNCTIDLAGTVNSTDTKTRFKFEFVASDYSNNIFIDNINLLGILGDIENPLNTMDLVVFPNPASKYGNLNISFMANDKDMTFELYNVNNQLLVSKTCDLKNQQVEFDLLDNKKLAAGCYFLKVTQGKTQRVEKVIIQ